MVILKSVSALLLAFIFILRINTSTACSTYKVTANGKTMVGSNYDTWLESPRIWFETTGIGASFSGARPDGPNGYAPQTGLNEFGLAFVTLATATPENGIPPSGKKQITNRTNYLKDILHSCKTTEDVKNYIEQYDHSTLSHDVFFYVDSIGNYLVVEPYKIISGNDAKYVLANFCPSTIKDFNEIKQERYKNGTAYLKDKIDVSPEFCTSLSDTMHVCRDKLGDGTLLTSILDLKEGTNYLYFYHDYKHRVKFNLKEELAKGNHTIELVSLFPPNEEYKKLTEFKTPLNSTTIDLLLKFSLFLFSFSSLVFLISYFRKRDGYKLLLFLVSVIMAYYMYALSTEINIYFYPAPYKDYKFTLMNIAAYIPFLLLALIVPLIIKNKNVIRDREWSLVPKLTFTLNSALFIVLIVLFCYWGLYNVL